ncbi:hypothetical protein OROHE_014751 [Orobanche hederae]
MGMRINICLENSSLCICITKIFSMINSKLMIKITLLLLIGFVVVDESQAIKKSTPPASPPIGLHTGTENHLIASNAEKTKKISENHIAPPISEDCYKDLHTSDKTHIAKLLCEDIDAPLRTPATYDCCIRLWNIDEKCYNILIEDRKKQYPCDKDRCDIRDRARQIWKYCLSRI